MRSLSINSSFEIEPWGGNYDSEVSQFQAFTNLKKVYPNLKTMVAVGGWTFNDPGATQTRFSDTASTAARRAKFAASCVEFCQTYNFDGVDLDWEYPAIRVVEARLPIRLTSDCWCGPFRDAFDAASVDLQLSMATPVAAVNLDAGYDLPTLAKGLDFFNIMTYDIHGAWDSPKVVGANTDMPYIFNAVKYFLNAGVSPNKLVLGLAAYGRTYTMNDLKLHGRWLFVLRWCDWWLCWRYRLHAIFYHRIVRREWQVQF
jgi:chitinase